MRRAECRWQEWDGEINPEAVLIPTRAYSILVRTGTDEVMKSFTVAVGLGLGLRESEDLRRTLRVWGLRNWVMVTLNDGSEEDWEIESRDLFLPVRHSPL